MNVFRLVDHPKGKAVVEELRAWLEPLIRWRFNVSDVHYGIADRSVEKIQSEVLGLLDSAWIDREIITTALRRARAAVSKGVDIQGSISLKMLLKPPLKTWEGHWENTKTPRGWKCLPAEDDCFADALQADYEMTRLGHIINAWGLEVDGEITEIIECWRAAFWPLDLRGQTDCQTCAGCHTFTATRLLIIGTATSIRTWVRPCAPKVALQSRRRSKRASPGGCPSMTLTRLTRIIRSWCTQPSGRGSLR